MFKRIIRLVRMHRLLKRRQPQPEEDLGGGDICSLQNNPQPTMISLSTEISRR